MAQPVTFPTKGALFVGPRGGHRQVTWTYRSGHWAYWRVGYATRGNPRCLATWSDWRRWEATAQPVLTSTPRGE